MKARIYALAWHVLPYAFCLYAGATLGLLLVQLFGSTK